MAVVIGHPNNKIHVYSLMDFELKFCLDSDFQMQKIINISVSKKTKFFTILYNDYNLEVYNLTEEKKVNQYCNCIKELLVEGNDMYKGTSNSSKNNIKNKTKTILSNAFSKLRNIIYEKNRKSFAKYRFCPENLDEDLHTNRISFNTTFEMTIVNNVHTLVTFERLNEIVLFIFKYLYYYR